MFDIAVADQPRVVGKADERGQRLLPTAGAIDADKLLPSLRSRLAQRITGSRMRPLSRHRPMLQVIDARRAPYFCSGCPHNRSTRVPDGALVGGGIGCHGMSQFMEPEITDGVASTTRMGSERAQWIGIAPFVETDHMFQNIGDGTYFHSGQLAVQASVAAGSHITYKLLFNDAIAMTGGQDPAESNALSVPRVCESLLAQGVRRIIVTTDDTHRYRGVRLPRNVDVWDRDRLIEAQEALAATEGVTVLIHDQRCAAENRRDRKRGRIATPRQRIVINERVCEGCGDCGVQSNCLSAEPVETAFGRKTRINQDSCNLDFSHVADAETQASPGSAAFTEATVHGLFKLMAFKDEYEVARLSLDPQVKRDVEERFGPGATVRWQLHPPILRAMGMGRKLSLGPWFTPGFWLLHRMRRLRGTRFDLFGYTALRRLERRLVDEYVELVPNLSNRVDATSLSVAVEIAALPDMVRGYESIKERNVESYRTAVAGALRRFDELASPDRGSQ